VAQALKIPDNVPNATSSLRRYFISILAPVEAIYHPREYSSPDASRAATPMLGSPPPQTPSEAGLVSPTPTAQRLGTPAPEQSSAPATSVPAMDAISTAALNQSMAMATGQNGLNPMALTSLYPFLTPQQIQQLSTQGQMTQPLALALQQQAQQQQLQLQMQQQMQQQIQQTQQPQMQQQQPAQIPALPVSQPQPAQPVQQPQQPFMTAAQLQAISQQQQQQQQQAQMQTLLQQQALQAPMDPIMMQLLRQMGMQNLGGLFTQTPAMTNAATSTATTVTTTTTPGAAMTPATVTPQSPNFSSALSTDTSTLPSASVTTDQNQNATNQAIDQDKQQVDHDEEFQKRMRTLQMSLGQSTTTANGTPSKAPSKGRFIHGTIVHLTYSDDIQCTAATDSPLFNRPTVASPLVRHHFACH
jgi:hypothetical protein